MSDGADLVAVQLSNGVPEARRAEFMMMYQGQKKSRTTALLLSLFLGVLGVDRFYLGQVGLGILKLLTFGGFFLWAFIDLFLVMGTADRKNSEAAARLAAMYQTR